MPKDNCLARTAAPLSFNDAMTQGTEPTLSASVPIGAARTTGGGAAAAAGARRGAAGRRRGRALRSGGGVGATQDE